MKTHEFKPEKYGVKFSPKKIVREDLKPLSKPTIMFPVTSEFEMESMNGIIYVSDTTKYLYFGMYAEDTILIAKKHTGSGLNVKLFENGVWKNGEKTDENFCADKVILDNISIQELEQSDISIGDIYFDFDKSETQTAQSRKTIQNLANVLNQHVDMQLFIYGYTDPDGSDEYNKILSQKRADFIKIELKKKNIQSDRLISIGNGELMNLQKEISHEKSRKVSFQLFE